MKKRERKGSRKRRRGDARKRRVERRGMPVESRDLRERGAGAGAGRMATEGNESGKRGANAKGMGERESEKKNEEGEGCAAAALGGRSASEPALPAEGVRSAVCRRFVRYRARRGGRDGSGAGERGVHGRRRSDETRGVAVGGKTTRGGGGTWWTNGGRGKRVRRGGRAAKVGLPRERWRTGVGRRAVRGVERSDAHIRLFWPGATSGPRLPGRDARSEVAGCAETARNGVIQTAHTDGGEKAGRRQKRDGGERRSGMGSHGGSE